MDQKTEKNKAQTILQQFIEETMEAEEFVEQYSTHWRQWQDNNVSFGEFAQDAIDNLFVACDAFVSDPAERDEFDIDEAELRDEAAGVLLILRTST